MRILDFLHADKTPNPVDDDEAIRSKAYRHYLHNSFHQAGMICPWFAAALAAGAVLCVANAAQLGAAQDAVNQAFLLITASFSGICAIVAYGFHLFVKKRASNFAQEALDSGVMDDNDIRNLYDSICKF